MIIRKEFKYEMGHIVRKAWSERCKKSFHGHSYVCEVLMTSRQPDNGFMAADFGFVKKYIHPFIDSFDHASWWWDLEEDKHLIDMFKDNFDRVIVTPWTTTAEMQAMMFYWFTNRLFQYLTKHDLWENGEKGVNVHSVRVHETTTGWAEAGDETPLEWTGLNIKLRDIEFSQAIKEDWPEEFASLYEKLIKEFD